MDTVSGIGVLDKTVRILEVVADAPARPADLASRTGMSRATAHRLAAGLETHGLLRRDDSGRYVLGLALIGLGRGATEAFPLALAAGPALDSLQQSTGESTQLFVADGGDRLCVAAVDSAQELRTIVSVGARLPLDVGSAGRVLNGAETTEGWVESVAERAPGVASVSAPVRLDGRMVAAVSVSGPIDRMTRSPGAAFGPLVVDAAAQVALATRPA